jgi:hypothetical protein
MQWLEILEGSFVWEARSLYLVAVAVLFRFIYPPALIVIGGFGVLVILVMARPFFFS